LFHVLRKNFLITQLLFNLLSFMRVSELLKPRTIYLITSSAEGKDNVFTASFVMPVSFEPPMACFSISPKRFTYSLLEKNKECVLNIATSEMEELVWYCGSHSGKTVDKFKEAKIQTEESVKVKPVRIKLSPVQLECKVKEFVPAGDHVIVICEVVEEHVKSTDYKVLMHVSGKETKVI
jgi:flavin reductase (DIM6/NTAB) family NADH-FMN oxidoreductase RutF